MTKTRLMHLPGSYIGAFMYHYCCTQASSDVCSFYLCRKRCIQDTHKASAGRANSSAHGAIVSGLQELFQDGEIPSLNRAVLFASLCNILISYQDSLYLACDDVIKPNATAIFTLFRTQPSVLVNPWHSKHSRRSRSPSRSSHNKGIIQIKEENAYLWEISVSCLAKRHIHSIDVVGHCPKLHLRGGFKLRGSQSPDEDAEAISNDDDDDFIDYMAEAQRSGSLSERTMSTTVIDNPAAFALRNYAESRRRLPYVTVEFEVPPWLTPVSLPPDDDETSDDSLDYVPMGLVRDEFVRFLNNSRGALNTSIPEGGRGVLGSSDPEGRWRRMAQSFVCRQLAINEGRTVLDHWALERHERRLLDQSTPTMLGDRVREWMGTDEIDGSLIDRNPTPPNDTEERQYTIADTLLNVSHSTHMPHGPGSPSNVPESQGTEHVNEETTDALESLERLEQLYEGDHEVEEGTDALAGIDFEQMVRSIIQEHGFLDMPYPTAGRQGGEHQVEETTDALENSGQVRAESEEDV